ncbi:hypothetical protein AusDCA_2546 [Desulfitobacterium sp. AusDCA]
MENARENAKCNGIDNVELIPGKDEDTFQQIQTMRISPPSTHPGPEGGEMAIMIVLQCLLNHSVIFAQNMA